MPKARTDTEFEPWQPTKASDEDYQHWLDKCAENGWTPPASKEDYEKQIDRCRKAIRRIW